jgi:ABC-type bacteriocin/lantibiotic exporter with double-glycine peptidase domain
MLISAVLEAISLALLSPFLSFIADHNATYQVNHHSYSSYILYLSNKFPEHFFLVLTLILIFCLLLSGVTKLFLLYINSTTSYSIGSYLSKKVYLNILKKPYLFHTQNNSSELSFLISAQVNSIPYNIILPCMNILSGIITIFLILFILLVLNPKMGLIAILGFSSIYLLIYLNIFSKLQFHSKNLAVTSNKVAKILDDGLGSIRDVKLGFLENFYSSLFEDQDRKLKSSYIKVALMSNIPKFSVETFSMCFVCFLAYLYSGENNSALISSIGVLLLASYKLLPALQQVYSAFVTIIASNYVLTDVLKPLYDVGVIKHSNNFDENFKKTFFLKNIFFGYRKNSNVINGISLKIKKGESIAIIGKSGSGKTTLLDIIMGLIKPEGGEIIIDGKKKDQLRYKISHVPQNIYLADISIKENIAFGIRPSLIDMNMVKESAKLAYLDDFIESLPNKYESAVGERGVLLSGGQIQRLGIARAIYSKPEILIIDEGTSALDSETELKIIESLRQIAKKTTLIISTHRLNNLKLCKKVYRISKGKISLVKM